MKSRILIIDDDQDFVQDLQLLLEGQFLVNTAYNEADGLRMVREEPPEIVLLDLMVASFWMSQAQLLYPPEIS